MTSCTCSPAPQREQRVDPLRARLADPDEDPARERDVELAREADRLEAARRDLVRRGPVRAALLPEPVGGRLQHDPHRGRHGPKRGELLARHDPGVQVRQEAGLVEHEPGAAREVLERRLAAELAQLAARDLVAELRLVAEREERLAAARRRARARDREHLVLSTERALSAPRRPRERAVAADVAAQSRQRDEDLRRVGDERAPAAAAAPPRAGRRAARRGGRRARSPSVASIRRCGRRAFVSVRQRPRGESHEVPVPAARRRRGRGRAAG